MNTRQMKILALLAKRKTATLEELAEQLSISRSTARRDVLALEELHAVTRNGGAVSLVASGSVLSHHRIRENEHTKEKQQIAAAAADFLTDGITLFLDGGTTTAAMCPLIKRFHNITVITNGLQAINELADAESVSLFVAGGYTRAGYGVIHGEPTVEFLKQFRADVCFISVDGIDSNGVYEASLQSSWVGRQMLANADCRVLLCDSAKFGRTMKFRSCDFSQLDYIITDRAPEEAIAAAIAAGGAELLVAAAE